MDLIRELCAWLCEGIYTLIAGLYNLFMNISRVELLTSDQIHPIYQRITMILTIVMVFYVTFETVKFVIQPDQFSDKEKGASKIVIRMVLVVLLIAFVPQIFSTAYWVQNKIFDTQVFSKVILGKQNVESDEFGKNLSYNILSMFYSLDTESFSESELEKAKCEKVPCKQLVAMNYNQLRTEGKLTLLAEGINGKDKNFTDPSTGSKVKKYYINFNGLFAVGVGAFIAYMLLLYCVDAGVRVVQLLYLQIIAPIPIMAYLSPKKDGMFEKWTKQCLTTYLDLFIRVGIIYFILLICQILGNAYTNGTLVNNVNGDGAWLIYVALIMGLLLFAHKMPKMLQELFPKMGAASGNFGLKATERVAPEAARAIGAGLGGVNRLVKGGMARAANTHRRNQEIKEKRRAAGKDTSWRAVNQERRQADKDARHAKRQNRQAQRAYNQEQRSTRSERNAVLAAERELAEAKRSGDAERIKKATEKYDKATQAHKNKRASLQANQDLDKAKKERDKLIASGTASAEDIKKANDNVKTAQAKVDAINSQQQYNDIVNSKEAQERMKEKNKAVDNIESDRQVKQAAVEKAEKELAEAKASGNPTAIADAQSKLVNAMQARDGNLDIYNQEQTIKANEAQISQKQSEIGQNNQMVSDAETKHAAATSAVSAAKTQLNDAKLQGDREIAAAQTVLNNVQTNAKTERDNINNNSNLSPEEKAKRLALLSKQEDAATEALAKAQVNRDLAVRKAQSELNTAQSNATQTQNALNAAKNTRDTNNARLESEIKVAEKTKNAAQQAKENSEKLRDSDYERAKQARDAYKKHLDIHNDKLTQSNSAVSEFTDRAKTNFEKSQGEYAKAQSDLAEIENQRYRSTIASGVSGAVGGAWRGASTGFKATKLEDIGKQVKEGEKKDREAIAAYEKWLNDGGTTTFSKIASSVEKNIGMMTDAQVYEMQIKNYDNQISTQKRLGSIEGTTAKHYDDAKSRSGSKLEKGEQKTNLADLGNEKIVCKDVNGNEYVIVDGSKLSEHDKKKMTTSQIYEQEKNKTKMAREKAQAAQQAYATAKAQGNVSQERLDQLQNEADEASKIASNEEQLLGQKKKKLEEYAITSVLRTPASLRRNINVQPDQALVENVENALQSIEESKRNQDTYNRMMVELKDENLKAAYRTGNITDCDTLDAIQTALKTIKGQRDREIATLETMSGTLKASSQLDSAKAADGTSGK